MTLMSTADATRIYGVPARTLNRWHAENRICRTMQSGHAWWNPEEVEQMVAMRHGRQRLRRRNVVADTPT